MQCNQEIAPPKKKSAREWQKRKFCSRSCYADYQRVNDLLRGSNSPAWKGGRTTGLRDGYVRIAPQASDEIYSSMFVRGYVLEHRIVMARALGRPLTPSEGVHHRNGIRDDNRLENLELRRTGHGPGATKHCLTCSSSHTAETLVSEFMGFAKNVAGKMITKYPMELDDARQLAYIGLIEAASRFNFEKHDSARGSIEQHFKTFAYFRIHGAIVDEYRKNALVPRTAYAKGERASIVSYDAELENEDGSIQFEVGAPDSVTDDVVALRDALEVLDEREYRIVMGQAVGMTGKELSEEFGVDESRISQISIAARHRLRETMDAPA